MGDGSPAPLRPFFFRLAASSTFSGITSRILRLRRQARLAQRSTALSAVATAGRVRGRPTGCVVRAAVSTARRVLSNGAVAGVQSGLCLDVTGGVNTTKLQPYTCHGDTNQRWSRT
ncbi:hypothetical protein TUSST3_13900 [Streptomyces sp. TUS-ST3]|nr:hypothetical protein TUSST3_13900 [Streptomyces sp. TUS-ST3]